MDIQPIDLGEEMRQGVQFCLDLPPVILCGPVASQGLHRCELYSLRRVCNRFMLGPNRCFDAPAQFGELILRNIHLKLTNRILVRCLLVAALSNSGLGHMVLLLMVMSVNSYECMQCTNSASGVKRLTPKRLRSSGVRQCRRSVEVWARRADRAAK